MKYMTIFFFWTQPKQRIYFGNE